MKITHELKVLLWRELLDLSRDRKTLFTSILLPLVMLPVIGLMSVVLVETQPIVVCIVDLDNSTSSNPLLGITVSSKWLVDNLTYYLKQYGYHVVYAATPDIISRPNIDVAVVIPKGFSDNATSLTLVARINVIKKAGVQAASRAEATIYSIVSFFSRKISDEKLLALARLAGVNATTDALRNPVQATTEVVNVQGIPVSPEVELKNAFARILVLALSFVVAPAASYVIDGIIGERERKTIELLLSSPVAVTRIIYAKMIAATVLGIITAVADALGLVAYMFLLSVATGVPFGLIVDPLLLLLHSVTAFFTILATISIALPFITRTRGIRSASNIVSIITTLGLVFFFTGFFVDYTRLPSEIIYPLYMVPYTHSILAIQSYVLGYPFRSFIHLATLALVSTILLYVVARTVNSEKLLVAPT